MKLLGILWGGPHYAAPGVVRAVPVPTAHQQIAFAQIPNNLGYCVKAEQLHAFEEHFGQLMAAEERARGEAQVDPANEKAPQSGSAVEAAE